jgi:hypothetical protein
MKRSTTDSLIGWQNYSQKGFEITLNESLKDEYLHEFRVVV